jgi:RNA polymerase sigma-70 factor (ECF subfamily)
VQGAFKGPVTDPAMQFRVLFEEHIAFVRRMVRCQGVSRADVDDVCQEIFVVIHRKLSEFAGRSSLRGWIYGITWRVCRDWLSRAHLHHEDRSGNTPEPPVSGDQERRLDQMEALEKLRHLLRNLDVDHQMVFLLYEVEKLAMKDVAVAVGCPLFTGYSRLRTARAEVRRAFREMNEQEGK